MRNFLAFLYISIIVLFGSCSHDNDLILPENKVWAHKVNTIDELHSKEKLFDGIETDLIYSPYQNKLFVCHDIEDTIDNLSFSEWLDAIESPQKHSYWLDIKDINLQNCDTIVGIIQKELKKRHIENHAFIENSSFRTLKRVKQLGMHTSLWVTNFHWTKIDTADWINQVQRYCDSCQPDALSCEWRMYDALTTFFPDKNIFLWHTPASYKPENVELTRMMCRNKSVKIVLVDYDEPCNY